MCVAFPHEALDGQNKLVKVRPELSAGPPPLLIWPRIGGDDEIDIGVRQVIGEPSPHLRGLLERVHTGGRPEIELVAPYLPAARQLGSFVWPVADERRQLERFWDEVRPAVSA